MRSRARRRGRVAEAAAAVVEAVGDVEGDDTRRRVGGRVVVRAGALRDVRLSSQPQTGRGRVLLLLGGDSTHGGSTVGGVGGAVATDFLGRAADLPQTAALELLHRGDTARPVAVLERHHTTYEGDVELDTAVLCEFDGVVTEVDQHLTHAGHES